MAHVHAAQAVLPSMLERGAGYLLNTVSAAGLLTSLGAAPYAVSKHAALAFSEWLAVTYAGKGIGVSALCPQAVRPKMIAEARLEEHPSELQSLMRISYAVVCLKKQK